MPRAPSAAAVLVTLAACAEDPAPPVHPGPVRCDEASPATEAASLPDRHLLGVARDAPVDPALEGQREALARSQRARREAGWRLLETVVGVERVTAGARTFAVPRFTTWYDQDDFRRVLGRLVEGLSPAERLARAAFGRAAIDDAYAWNAEALLSADGWTPERWTSYLQAIDSPENEAGVGGIRRLLLNGAATTHVLESYAPILDCVRDGPPPALAHATGREAIERFTVDVDRCEELIRGPFFAGAGARVAAELRGARGALALELLAGDSPALAVTVCAHDDGAPCEVTGPGRFFVRVRAGGAPATAELEVRSADPTAPPVGCLAGPFPPSAVSIAAEWRRIDPALPFLAYDTSGAALRARLDGDGTWGPGHVPADPGPDVIHTVETPSGARYRLAAFHVRSRALGTWIHATYFWSPDPSSDFGADRPDAIASLGGPWSHYKMCVATEHVERDADPRGGFGESHPTLGAALEAAHRGEGGPTWCSNPFIDAAPGLARGNCVGCHQHAMGGLRPGEIALDHERYPDGARLAFRDNHPADGYWGLDAGDDLARVIAATLEHHSP